MTMQEFTKITFFLTKKDFDDDDDDDDDSWLVLLNMCGIIIDCYHQHFFNYLLRYKR